MKLYSGPMIFVFVLFTLIKYFRFHSFYFIILGSDNPLQNDVIRHSDGIQLSVSLCHTREVSS